MWATVPPTYHGRGGLTRVSWQSPIFDDPPTVNQGTARPFLGAILALNSVMRLSAIGRLVLAAVALATASCGRGVPREDEGTGNAGAGGAGAGNAGAGGAETGGAGAGGAETGGAGAGGAETGGAGAGGATGGRGGTGGSGATAGTQGRGGSPSSCHYDCFGRTTCLDGVVTSWANTPVSCSAWTGSCPHYVVETCRKGCSASEISTSTLCPLAICKENVPKVAGDPCETDDECRPSRARTTGTTTPENVYLRCDVAAGICVSADPPVLADWLAGCTPGLLTSLGGVNTGLVRISDPQCSSGLCMAAGETTCVRNGCTMACRSDDECPTGAICTGASCDPFAVDRTGFCAVSPQTLPCLSALGL